MAVLIAVSLVACGKGVAPGGAESADAASLDREPVFTISGAAQKGPFVKGARILINRLDKNVGNTYETSVSYIQDDLGNFTFPVKRIGPILLEADGVNFNEVTGQLSQNRLQLRALYNVTGEANQRSHINVLTHLAYKRILKLIQQGVDVNAAISMGQAAVLASLQGVFSRAKNVEFSNLSLFEVGDGEQYGNAFLLSLSATLSQYVLDKQLASGGGNFDSQLAYTLNVLADEIAENGRIENQEIIAGLNLAATELAPDKIKRFLESRGFGATQNALIVADMNLVVDTDGDGIVNAEDPDDDNDGIPDDADASPYIYSETPMLSRATEALSFPTQTDVSLEWSASSYAARIETQQSAAADFPPGAKTTSLTGTVISTRFERAGTYYVRARAGNTTGAWGPWGSVYQITAGTFSAVLDSVGARRYLAVLPTRDGGSIVFGRDEFDSATKLDRQGKFQWTYTYGVPGYQFENKAIAEFADGTLVFRGVDPTDCCRPCLVAVTGQGKFLWSKFTAQQGDNSWTLTNPAEHDGRLYAVYLGQVCVDRSRWATCSPLAPLPKLLEVDLVTGVTVASVPLTKLDALAIGSPTVSSSNEQLVPPLKSEIGVGIPDELEEPVWAKVFSLFTTQQNQLVVTLTTRWYRHDCIWYECANSALIGFATDGVANWIWKARGMSDDRYDFDAVAIPGAGFVLGRLTTNNLLPLLSEVGEGRPDFFIPDILPSQAYALRVSQIGRYLYLGGRVNGGVVVGVADKETKTIRRIEVPCGEASYCVPLSFAENADGGVTVLYETRKSDGQPVTTAISKISVNG